MRAVATNDWYAPEPLLKILNGSRSSFRWRLLGAKGTNTDPLLGGIGGWEEGEISFALCTIIVKYDCTDLFV